MTGRFLTAEESARLALVNNLDRNQLIAYIVYKMRMASQGRDESGRFVANKADLKA